MIGRTLPLAPDLWMLVRAPDPAPLLGQLATLRLENADLRAQNAVLQERIRELEARLGQNSANSSRPASSDPPQVAVKRRALPSGRKRAGQPGHRGAVPSPPGGRGTNQQRGGTRLAAGGAVAQRQAAAKLHGERRVHRMLSIRCNGGP